MTWRLINADACIIKTHRTFHLYIIQIYSTTGVMWRAINATWYTLCSQNFTDLPKNGTIYTNMYRIIVQIVQSCVTCLWNLDLVNEKYCEYKRIKISQKLLYPFSCYVCASLYFAANTFIQNVRLPSSSCEIQWGCRLYAFRSTLVPLLHIQ